jgi:hypothetical protein
VIEVFVELFDEPYEQFEEMINNKTKECDNILDYYEKFYKKKNRIMKFTFEIQMTLNGAVLEYRHMPIEEFDGIEIGVKFQKVGLQSFERYMEFLHNAYKEDAFITDSFYAGSWVNSFNQSSFGPV